MSDQSTMMEPIFLRSIWTDRNIEAPIPAAISRPSTANPYSRIRVDMLSPIATVLPFGPVSSFPCPSQRKVRHVRSATLVPDRISGDVRTEVKSSRSRNDAVGTLVHL